MVSHLALNIGTLSQDLGHELSRGDKLFIGPKHNIYTFFMILFGLFDLRLIFVCQFLSCVGGMEYPNILKRQLHSEPPSLIPKYI